MKELVLGECDECGSNITEDSADPDNQFCNGCYETIMDM